MFGERFGPRRNVQPMASSLDRILGQNDVGQNDESYEALRESTLR